MVAFADAVAAKATEDSEEEGMEVKEVQGRGKGQEGAFGACFVNVPETGLSVSYETIVFVTNKKRRISPIRGPSANPNRANSF